MLKTMRANAGSWIIKFLLLAIVIVFVFWGVGSYKSQKAARLATVNGNPISYDEYNKAYFKQVEQLKRQFGGNLDENMLKMLNVREQVLNELIDVELLLEEARRMDLEVTTQELADAIRQIPAFQENGRFNNRRYQMLLANNRLSPDEFESLQKEAMLIGKLQTVLFSMVTVSDAEALEWYNYNEAEADLAYVLFAPESYKDVTVDDAAVKAHFDENMEAYRTPPMVKACYFRFSPDQYRSKVTISKERLAAYYGENKSAFLSPKTVEARHILIKIPENAAPSVVAEKKAEAEKIMEMAKAGQDFAELAKKYSEGPSSTNGGYLGTFEKNRMVAPFSEAAFAMKVGDISEPVQTRFGWHIIKVESVNEERQKRLEEVSAEIKKELAGIEAETLAYNDAETAYDDSFDDDSLKSIADFRKFELLTTDFFSSTGPKNVAQPGRFAEVAFALENGEISNIETIGSDFYIIQALEQKPAQIPDFEAVQEKVKADLVKKMQDEKAQKDAQDLLAKLAMSGGEEGAKELPEFKNTGFFKRNASIPTIGYEKDIAAAAFLLTPEKKVPEKVLKGTKGYYVIRFKDRKMPEKSAFGLEKDDIIKELVQQKQKDVYTALVKKLREESDITIAEGFGNS